MAIITDKSPFRNLPTDLNPEQRAFLDGMRFAVEMADLSYMRLCATLYALTARCTTLRSPGEEVTIALVDAWSIVDSVHRLRELAHYFPNMSRRTRYEVFRRKTARIDALRNAVQHLRGEIRNLATTKEPVWGTISWFTLTNAEPPIGFSCLLVAGTLTAHARAPIADPAGKQIRSRVDFVSLHAHGISISLSECMLAVETLAKAFEEAMAPQFEGHRTSGTDLVFCAQMKFYSPRGSESSETPNMTNIG